MNDFSDQEQEMGQPQKPKKGWFGRNWLWVVPIGCFVPVLVCGGIIAMVVFGAMGAIRSSEAYLQSLATVQASAKAKDALGDNIQPGYVAGGSIQLNNDEGRAEVAYDVSGPKGTGMVQCSGTKKAGKWTFTKMDLQITSTGEIINLLE